MVTLIILIVIFAASIYASYKTMDFWPVVTGVLSGAYLFLHILALCLMSYFFEVMIEERNAFQQTLNEIRQNGSEYETAAIVGDVAEWNAEIARAKYENKHPFFGQYIDDRIENVKPIK